MSCDTLQVRERSVTSVTSRVDASREAPRRIAYVMSRFPKITETFVLFEMMAVEQHGAHVEVFPLLRARNSTTHPEGAAVWTKFVELFRRPVASAAVMHPQAEAYVARAHFVPFINSSIIAANLYFLVRRPAAYLSALWTMIRANWGSANFLLGGLALYPKAVYFARRAQKLGVVHVHAHFANHPAAAAYVIGRLSGIPYSFTAHGADLQVDQHMLREKVSAARRVVTISNVNKQFIHSICPEMPAEHVTVIRCGVDTQVFASQREPQEQTIRRPLRIVCVGTMYPVKGHAYLIQACERLANGGVAFECHLVGEGPLRQELEQQVRAAGLERHVVFHGRQTREQISELHRSCDVLVAPSVPTREGRREGIPVVLMEGMASGLAVVATNISGIPELVVHRETGWLVPSRDADALADALATLANDAGLRAALGRAGRETVVREFDLYRNSRQLLDVFFDEAAR
jgi:colanic acid/amylovoran biosynthesis glycosyltransferase